ncbi:MAG TPA: hypothetical protein VHS06_05930 [Chloroflexota bacterium]|nr:hypothetical protein [Chloroflexota bacterium]
MNWKIIELAGVLAVLMSLVHIFAGRIRFLNVVPRSRWLSMSGGIAVAYVFVHLLPEISRGQSLVIQKGSFTRFFREQHIYLTALAGLVAFYGLERAAKISKPQTPAGQNEALPNKQVFWLHIVSFGLYNMLIGYLLVHREVTGLRSLLFFWFAMSLHFLTNDYDLRQDFKDYYRHVGRWILAAAVLAGWGIGILFALNDVALAFLFAFLAGGVVLNVLKGELPAERESNFWAFVSGVALYTILLLFT